MEVYHAGGHVDHKADASPVTEADARARSHHSGRPGPAFPDIPVRGRGRGRGRSRARSSPAGPSSWSIRSTAPRNSSTGATISPSTSRWCATACRCSASSMRRPARRLLCRAAGSAERLRLVTDGFRADGPQPIRAGGPRAADGSSPSRSHRHARRPRLSWHDARHATSSRSARR